MLRILVVLVWIAALASCASEIPPTDSTAGSTEPIVDGTPTAGDQQAVVSVVNRIGSLCTGTVIAPRVVLTAKHCVQTEGASEPYDASFFVVGVGDYIYGQSLTFNVTEITTTPGSYSVGLNGLIGLDIALLTLTTGTTIPPVTIYRDDPVTLIGTTVTAIGFGQTPDGRSGRKYVTSTNVTGVNNGNIYTPPAICQGDSGGPLLTEDGAVVGISSWGSGNCGSGINGFNTIYQYLDMIDQVIGDSGSCINDGDEHCDGFDNDCNDLIDEGCSDVGEACSTVENCVGGPNGGLLCDTAGGTNLICTRSCDPMRPLVGCPAGMFCARTSDCSGLCRSGEVGTAAVDTECDDHTDCASLNCLDPGDNRKRCLEPCEGNAGMCLAGEACAALPDQCAGCVPASIVIGTRGLGEPCDEDSDCYSSECWSERGQDYCSQSCTSDSDCGERFHCRTTDDGGFCIQGAREGIGAGCITAGDCGPGQGCATRGTVSWCTIGDCTSNDDCPANFECVNINSAQVCAPLLALPGEDCIENGDCISSLCTTIDDASVCTRYCSPEAPCSPGYECRRLSTGAEPVCVQTFEPQEAGGGGCAVSRRHVGDTLVFVIGLGLALATLRRRS